MCLNYIFNDQMYEFRFSNSIFRLVRLTKFIKPSINNYSFSNFLSIESNYFIVLSVLVVINDTFLSSQYI